MFFKEAKGILSQNNGFNIFRGCVHGCIYCDSRSKCYHIDHPFDDVEVKTNALVLLEKALISKREKCMIGTGSMCDPYSAPEAQICYTRKALEIIDRHGFGIALQTKSTMVMRDLELSLSTNSKAKTVLEMTLTTADEKLCKIIEPNVQSTKERVEVLKAFRDKGIPTVVWLCPFLPYINDDEKNLNALIDYCIEAKVHGILFFGIGLTLREGNREYFYKQLDRSFPGMKERYEKEFGDSYEVASPNSQRLEGILRKRCEENGILYGNDKVFSYLREFPREFEQLKLF